MCATTAQPPEEIESPGYGFRPDELPFSPSWGSNLLESVVAAIWSSLDHPRAQYLDTAAGDFVGLLTHAAQRLGRVLTEGGPGVEEDALRAALPKLEKAAELRGTPDGVDRFAKHLAGDVNAQVGTHLHAASEILDWCIAGCRARLAEMEDETTPRENGDSGDPADLLTDVVDALALGEKAALDLAPEMLHEEAEQLALEVQGVRKRVEDRLGIDGEESEARIIDARERFERLVEGGGGCE